MHLFSFRFFFYFFFIFHKGTARLSATQCGLVLAKNNGLKNFIGWMDDVSYW
jgi:hypothetical protein